MEGCIVDEVGALYHGAKQAFGLGTRELKEGSSRNCESYKSCGLAPVLFHAGEPSDKQR